VVKPGSSGTSASQGQESGTARTNELAVDPLVSGSGSKSVPNENFVQGAGEVPAEKGLAGRWLLTLVLESEVSQPWMIEITGTESNYTAKVVDSLGSIAPARPEIRDFRQVGDHIQFGLAQETDSWPFDGAIDGDRVRGCIEVRDRLTLAWLERTRLGSMRSVQASSPVQGWASFEAAQRADDPKILVKQLQEFLDEHADSPLVFDALRVVLRLSRRAEMSEEQLRAAAERYEEYSRKWGKRWNEHALESMASDLATADGPANAAADALALQYAERARAALAGDALPTRKQTVELAHAMALVRNARAEEGKKILDDLLERAPDEGEFRYYAAQAAEQLSDLDGAIELLIPLWPHPLATRELERVWRQKNGTLDGLDQRLDEIYLKRFPPLTVETHDAEPDAKQQVAVVELFTGTSCFPCVAPDSAFEALGRTFKQSQAVLLQYHLHVPGPDPLANSDAIARAQYYKVQGTPWFLVNGREGSQASGPRQRAPSVYTEYRADIEKQLDRKSDIQLNVTASRDKDEISIQATIAQAGDAGEKLKLRIALVEELVRFNGRNGLRLHHQVVRTMPGGAEGIDVTENELNYRTTVNLSQLREAIEKELTDFAQQFSAESQSAFEFTVRPMELQQLGVVAFLQDDSSGEVLQAAFAKIGNTAGG
jgi:hypothetical protein